MQQQMGPRYIEVDPPPPSKEFEKAVTEHVPQLLDASRAFVKAKEGKWKRHLALWEDSIDLHQWREWDDETDEKPETNRRREMTASSGDGDTDNSWESNYTHAPGYMVDQYCDNAYPMLFSGPEWLTVISEDVSQISSPDDYPAHRKVQQLLLGKLSLARINARIYEALWNWTLNGTVYGKVFWHEFTTPVFYQDTYTGEIFEDQEAVYSCPVIQAVPIDMILPDPKALHNDIQRWRFIGHRVHRTYDEIIAGFENGIYSLNRDDVEQRWAGVEGGDAVNEQSSLVQDKDAAVEPQDKAKWVELWEFHGKVPWKHQLRECAAVFAISKGADTCANAILIRCSQAPLLRKGLRPFVCSHFMQYPGPFGQSIFDRNEKLLYTISQLIAQFEDNARLTANCAWSGGPGFKRQIEQLGGSLPPGSIVETPIGEQEPRPLAPLNFPAQEIHTLIQDLEMILQQRTAVTATFTGVGNDSNRTATAANLQQMQSMKPAQTRTDLFTRDFVEPALNIALKYCQQLANDTETIVMAGSDGSPQPVEITADELQRGKYKVVCTLTHNDAMSVVKAQSIERMIPVLANLQQILMQEGAQVNFAEIIRRYVDLIGVEGADRIVRMLTTQEQQMMQEIQNLQMQLQQLMAEHEAMLKGQPNGGPAPNDQPPDRPDPSQMEGPPPPPMMDEQPPPMMPIGSNGGPDGPIPTDQNTMEQLLQLAAPGSAMQGGPVY